MAIVSLFASESGVALRYPHCRIFLAHPRVVGQFEIGVLFATENTLC
jgi:hypothetical protein